jgi:dephospho-CoA kinase
VIDHRENKSNFFIIVTGLPGSGKTTFCKFLSKTLNLKVINAGDCLIEYLNSNKIKVADRINTGHIFLKYFDENKVFEVIRDISIERKANIIDGIRLPSTFLSFANSFNNVINIFIEIQEEIRSERFINRLIKDNKINTNDKENMKDQYFSEILQLRKFSKFIIENNGDLRNLMQKAETLSIL